jgi:hypothetical protein
MTSLLRLESEIPVWRETAELVARAQGVKVVGTGAFFDELHAKFDRADMRSRCDRIGTAQIATLRTRSRHDHADELTRLELKRLRGLESHLEDRRREHAETFDLTLELCCWHGAQFSLKSFLCDSQKPVGIGPCRA